MESFTDDDDWYAFVIGGNKKGMMIQKDQNLRMNSSGMDDYQKFEIERVISFTASYAGAVDYMFPQSAAKVVN